MPNEQLFTLYEASIQLFCSISNLFILFTTICLLRYYFMISIDCFKIDVYIHLNKCRFVNLSVLLEDTTLTFLYRFLVTNCIYTYILPSCSRYECSTAWTSLIYLSIYRLPFSTSLSHWIYIFRFPYFSHTSLMNKTMFSLGICATMLYQMKITIWWLADTSTGQIP